jgi:caffeoyl-CoA O-methyltransferase
VTDHLTYDRVQEHLSALVPEREPELRAMEEHARQTGFPIIGPAAGYACYQIARLAAARRVFELGSGFGYSTAWFARAVRENGGGVVHHVVWDEDLSRRARGHLAALGFGDVVRYTVGEAVAALQAADGPFDLVFNDIDKEGYPASIAVIAEKLRPGGVLLIDNMFRGGRVFDPEDRSKATEAVRETTRLLCASPDWLATILPVRDGVGLAIRR